MQIENERNDDDAVTYANWLSGDNADCRKDIFPFAEGGPRCSEPPGRGKKFFHFGFDDIFFFLSGRECVCVSELVCALSCCCCPQTCSIFPKLASVGMKGKKNAGFPDGC